MAWAYVQTTTETTWDQYQRVAAELGDEAPEGLIVHAAGPYGPGVRIIDVWESEAAHDRFRDERLRPAIVRVIGEEAMAQRQPAMETLDVQHVIKP